jgi:hypothetical protein
MAVVRQIESGRLSIGSGRGITNPPSVPTSNVIELPVGYRSVAKRVYAERRPDGRLFVLFVTWIGRGTDVNGYLYCRLPLEPVDFSVGPSGREQLDACRIDDLEPTHIRGGWYYVCRRLG